MAAAGVRRDAPLHPRQVPSRSLFPSTPVRCRDALMLASRRGSPERPERHRLAEVPVSASVLDSTRSRQPSPACRACAPRSYPIPARAAARRAGRLRHALASVTSRHHRGLVYFHPSPCPTQERLLLHAVARAGAPLRRCGCSWASPRPRPPQKFGQCGVAMFCQSVIHVWLFQGDT